jgi:methyl-galactoside transport system substrate-binding protein
MKKKGRWQWIRLLFLPVVFLALTGCGRQGKNEVTSIKIGVSVYNQYDTFISQLMTTFEAVAKEKEEETGGSILIDVQNAAGSQSEQNNQIEDFINSGCDILCVNLVDRTDPTMIIDKAKSADIPVIFFNRELVEEDLERWEKLYYVGAVALESGILQGEIVVETYQNTPDKLDKNKDGILQYVILEGEAGHQDAIIRTEYSVNTIEEGGIAVEKLGHAIANWNRGQAQAKMQQWLETLGDKIELVLANNDDMALGAIDALKAAGISLSEAPFIVGIDGTEAAMEVLEEGWLSGTVFNDSDGQARQMLLLAYDLATGSSTDDVAYKEGRYVRLPYQKVLPKEEGDETE